MATIEQNGVWPYRVIENDRITYFQSESIANSYLGLTDGALERYEPITCTWQHVAGKEHDYGQRIRPLQEL